MTVIIMDNDSCQRDSNVKAEKLYRNYWLAIPYIPGIFSLFDINPDALPVHLLSDYGKQLCPLP